MAGIAAIFVRQNANVRVEVAFPSCVYIGAKRDLHQPPPVPLSATSGQDPTSRTPDMCIGAVPRRWNRLLQRTCYGRETIPWATEYSSNTAHHSGRRLDRRFQAPRPPSYQPCLVPIAMKRFGVPSSARSNPSTAIRDVPCTPSRPAGHD